MQSGNLWREEVDLGQETLRYRIVLIQGDLLQGPKNPISHSVRSIFLPAQEASAPPSAYPILEDSHPIYVPASFLQHSVGVDNSLLDMSRWDTETSDGPRTRGQCCPYYKYIQRK